METAAFLIKLKTVNLILMGIQTFLFQKAMDRPTFLVNRLVVYLRLLGNNVSKLINVMISAMYLALMIDAIVQLNSLVFCVTLVFALVKVTKHVVLKI